jgi:hypothetical protein
MDRPSDSPPFSKLMNTRTQNKATRAEMLFKKLEATGRITEAGRGCLEQVLDPFPDEPRNTYGWFNNGAGASLTRLIKKSVPVTKPVGLPAGNWDCHVIQWPFLNLLPFTRSTFRENNVLQYSNTPVVNLGGLQVFGTPPGVKLDLTAVVAGPPTQFLIASLNVEPTLEEGLTRTCGVGYEIHDTTAPLYQQGSVTSTTQSAVSEEPTGFTATDTVNVSNFTAKTVRFPPGTPSEALLMSGAKQWEAKYGVYSVARYTDATNPPLQPSATVPIIMNNATDEKMNPDFNTSQVFFPVPSPSVIAGTHRATRTTKIHPITMQTSIMSGLHESASLLVNGNYYQEEYPGVADPGSAQLATNKGVWDPLASEILTETVQNMPVAVPVADNGLGDWILEGASKVGSFLGPLIGSTGLPGASVVGGLISAASNSANKYISPKFQAQPTWEQAGGNYDHFKNQALNNQAQYEASLLKREKNKVKRAKKKRAKINAQNAQAQNRAQNPPRKRKNRPKQG